MQISGDHVMPMIFAPEILGPGLDSLIADMKNTGDSSQARFELYFSSILGLTQVRRCGLLNVPTMSLSNQPFSANSHRSSDRIPLATQAGR